MYRFERHLFSIICFNIGVTVSHLKRPHSELHRSFILFDALPPNDTK